MFPQIRDSIISLVHPSFATAYPAVPIYYDNQAVDLNNLPERFVTLEIKFYDGKQINIAANPSTRYRGYVYATVHSRIGLGNRTNLEILSWFAQTLGYARSGTVQLEAAEPTGPDEEGGWYHEEIKVPFHADRA